MNILNNRRQRLVDFILIEFEWSFYVFENNTVIDTSIRKCVLHILVPTLKYRSAVWQSTMALTYFASSVIFKPRIVMHFAIFFGYINLGL